MIRLPVGVFDFSKGMVLVLVARYVLGLGIAEQMAVGLAAVVGHNWSVFLRFSGGRGVGTAAGLIFLVPLINSLPPWALLAFLTVLVAGTAYLRSTPLPVLVALVVVTLVSWRFYPPLSITLGFLAMLLIIITKRLTAQRSAEAIPVSKRQVLLNRLFFDRDIADRKAWMYRRPARQETKDG